MMRRRVGRPLVRTAAVGGVAYMAGSSAARKSAAQQQQDADQNEQIAQLQGQSVMAQQASAQPMPSSTSPAARDPLDQLKQLGELKAAGVLTDDEFEVKKAELLKQI